MDKRFTKIMRSTVAARMTSTAFAPWSPDVDLYENEAELIVFMDAAGVDPKQITIVAEAKILTISGKRYCPISEIICVHQLEIEYGKFECKLNLPKEISVKGTTSESKNGFLVIRMPLVKHKGSVPLS